MIAIAKNLSAVKPLVLGLAILCAACTAPSDGDGVSGQHAASAAAIPAESNVDSTEATAKSTANASAPALPERFTAYATTAVGQGRVCVVGAVSDEDGAAQRPVVLVRKGIEGPVLWTQPLSGLDGMYQTRATHCADSGSHLYVLMQSDTNAAQSLSQTQLSVAKLAESGGAAPAEYVGVPGTSDKPFSAWVSPGEANFRIEKGALKLQAHYFLMDNRNAEEGIAIALDLDLKPL